MFVLVLQTSYPVYTGKLAAIAVGSVGIILVSTSGIGLAAESEGHCGYNKEEAPQANYTSMIEVTNNSVNSTKITGAKERFCTPFTAVELATSLLALMGGSLMWSISSSKLFHSNCMTLSVNVLEIAEKDN